jgi:hypothetical protein
MTSQTGCAHGCDRSTLLPRCCSPASKAQTQSPSALAGKVTSQEDGDGGVLVSAKRAGSTMTITVVSDAQGQYVSRDRLIRENTLWRSKR